MPQSNSERVKLGHYQAMRAQDIAARRVKSGIPLCTAYRTALTSSHIRAR